MSKEKSSKKKIEFQKLTPFNQANLGIYNDSLDFVWDDSELLNVALTGPYGSGKSSVIRTYIKKNEKENVLYVSLASFKEYSSDDKPQVIKSRDKENEKKQSYYTEAALEGKIINQIVHQIPAKEIPQSDFKIKEKMTPSKMIATTKLLFTFLISALIILNYSKVKEFLFGIISLNDISAEQIINAIIIISLLLLLLSSYKLLEIAVRFFYEKRNFKNLKIFNAEIELHDEKDTSYFDKYLNEIIYILKESKVEVIIFEDIDRFETNIFFTKLKEINTLVNNKIDLENEDAPNKRLKFIYLIKDDMFSANERTKFFDYIVPIIPIIDSSNSYARLLGVFKKELLNDENHIDNTKITKRLLYDLSLFISDMRILKNIYNEYIIYKDRISFSELGLIANNLLGLIAYKNIFPSDFMKLQFNHGYVYAVLDRKDDLIKIKEAYYKEEIGKLEKEIRRYNSATNEELGTYEQLDESQKTLENLPKLSFHELTDLFSEEEVFYNLRDIEEFSEITKQKNVGLIVYLINNDYINQTYIEYMSYFHKGDLSGGDKNAYLKIVSHVNQPYDLKLDKPGDVLERLEISDFERSEILNFSLMDFAIENNHVFLDEFYRVIIKEEKQSFILEYLESGYGSKLKFVKEVNERWNQFAYKTITGKSYKYSASSTEFKNYLLLTFETASIKTLESLNIEEELSNFISKDKAFLNIKAPNIKKIIEAFETLNVSFEIIEFEESEEGLFNEVYNHHLYNLNWDMLELILNKKFNVSDEKIVLKENYTIINSQAESPLYEYIHTNINDYLEVWFANDLEVINDSEESVLKLLNNEDIEPKYINQYMELFTAKVTSLIEVEDTKLWRRILDRNRITFSEENIAVYFSKNKKLDSSLINLINQQELNYFDPIPFSEDDLLNFEKRVMLSNDINVHNYEIILKGSLLEEETYELTELEEERVNILISIDLIKMNIQGLLLLRGNFPRLVLKYIKKNLDEYFDLVSNNPNQVIVEEIVMILSSMDITNLSKVRLIESVGRAIESYTITDLNYPLSLEEKIIGEYFDQEDLEYVVSNYVKYSQHTKYQIINHIINDITRITSEEIKLSEEVLKELLVVENLDIETKKLLLYHYRDSLGLKLIEDYLVEYDENELVRLFHGGRPREIEITDANKLLLEYFIDKVIRGYRVDEEGKYYTANGMREVVY